VLSAAVVGPLLLLPVLPPRAKQIGQSERFSCLPIIILIIIAETIVLRILRNRRRKCFFLARGRVAAVNAEHP